MTDKPTPCQKKWIDAKILHTEINKSYHALTLTSKITNKIYIYIQISKYKDFLFAFITNGNLKAWYQFRINISKWVDSFWKPGWNIERHYNATKYTYYKPHFKLFLAHYDNTK